MGGEEGEAYADTILFCHYRHGFAGSGMSRVGAVIHCGVQSLKNVSVHNPEELVIRNGVELGSVCSASPHGLASSCNEVSVLMPHSHTVGNLCHDSVDTALQATAWRSSLPPRLVTWALKSVVYVMCLHPLSLLKVLCHPGTLSPASCRHQAPFASQFMY